jgi:hypothetical protein
MSCIRAIWSRGIEVGVFRTLIGSTLLGPLCGPFATQGRSYK